MNEIYEMYKMYKMYEMHEIYEMYKMYEMYEIYEMYEMYEEDIRKYETDERYPSHTLSRLVSPLIPSLSSDTQPLL